MRVEEGPPCAAARRHCLRHSSWQRRLAPAATPQPRHAAPPAPRGQQHRPLPAQIRGRTRNKANLVKLFVEALGRQTLPHDGVEGSGAYIREVLKPAGRRLPFGIKRGVDLP